MSEQCGSRRHNWVCTLDKGHVDAHREYGVMLKAGWTNDEARAAREADIAAIVTAWWNDVNEGEDTARMSIPEWAAAYAEREARE